MKTAGLGFTNLDKPFFPEAGLNKGDVIRFYREAAPFLLPHLSGRPITLERMPEGCQGEGSPLFWQKNVPARSPSWLPRITLPTETGKEVAYPRIDDERILLYWANLGTITFHPWLSRLPDLERPDLVVFDLDPAEGGFASLVRIARTLRTILTHSGFYPWLKTSGKRGLHLLVPWNRRSGFEDARHWAEDVAREAVLALPGLATLERRISARHGKTYIDVIQNARGHHAVPPYVIRAVPHASVSTPLDWRELSVSLDPGRFGVAEVLGRLKKRGDLFHELVEEIAPRSPARKAA